MRSITTTALAAVLLGGCSGSPGPAPHPIEPPGSVAPPAPAPCLQGSADAVAAFPDANLERAVRGALEVGPDEPLTCALLASLTVVHAPDGHIEHLRGIENLVNLEELYIYGNNSIRDVGPLSALTALRDLNLDRNQVQDLGPLAGLYTLTSLSLYGNPIQDLGPLAGLTRLSRLRVEHAAGVADLTALQGLTALTRLELAGNQIVDLHALTGLMALTRLSLRGNAGLSDITPLRQAVALEILSLGGTAVSDLNPLAGLSGLTTLGLEDTAVRDLGPLIGLTALSRLDLRGNRHLTDVQPLLFNTGLGAGDAVRLERTGVRCEDVATLRLRDITVLTMCQ